jgi:hypothetical protein
MPSGRVPTEVNPRPTLPMNGIISNAAGEVATRSPVIGNAASSPR